MMKKWEIKVRHEMSGVRSEEEILSLLLENRGLTEKEDIDAFLHPVQPEQLTAADVDIDLEQLRQTISRMSRAIAKKESIVVYADYDADGITAGAVMWEALHSLGAVVMPYIPHRVDEGYGMSNKGIDSIIADYHPTLIVTVDHGITAWEKVAYATSKGIDVIVTDHHVKPAQLPECTIVHTTKLSGAGISWFVVKELINNNPQLTTHHPQLTTHNLLSDLLSLAAIGTIADMVPLTHANRSIAKYGLDAIGKTKRIGLIALIEEAGLRKESIGTYEISHILAPRLNAMGRLVHAMDALRLLCIHREEKARELAQKLGTTNKERQQLTIDTTVHALDLLKSSEFSHKKLLFISHKSYNQGIIGLVAGKLVEEYYRPSIVIAIGEIHSKASARSISGFNIVEAIRSCSDLLVDVGGHPMAAGFTVETKNLTLLQERLEKLAEQDLDDQKLTRTLYIDMELPLSAVTGELWNRVQAFEPFGMGNYEPVFATMGVTLVDTRLVGAEGKHLKLRIQHPKIRDSRNNGLYNSENSGNRSVDAIAFGMGNLYSELKPGKHIDIAYTIDMNEWNGTSKLQLKIKDIKV